MRLLSGLSDPSLLIARYCYTQLGRAARAQLNRATNISFDIKSTHLTSLPNKSDGVMGNYISIRARFTNRSSNYEFNFSKLPREIREIVWRELADRK
jgi:hypothetical protein